jgi:Arm DNA-binding domain
VKKIPFGSGTYLDKTMRGFMVVSNAVSKSYVFQRKIKGRSVRVTLGRVGEITAEEARDAAMAAWLQMKQGVNPNEQKRENRVRGMTLREAFSRWWHTFRPTSQIFELSQNTLSAML